MANQFDRTNRAPQGKGSAAVLRAKSAVVETASQLSVDPIPVPAVRREKVARAKRLIQDPGYPPRQVLQAVARRLARDWTKGPTAS